MNIIWIKEASYISNINIFLKFNDGVQGIVNLQNELDLPIYNKLKDPQYFKNFKLNSWTIEWPNGADFAPEFLYKILKPMESNNINILATSTIQQ